MPESVSRRKIMRACKSRGWMVQPAALAAIHRHLNVLDDDYLEDVLLEISLRVDRNTVITESVWNEIMEASHSPTTNDKEEDFELVNAFESPRLSYDSMRKTFRVEEKQWALLGSVADKVSMMAQRYAIIQQRLLRHGIFRRKKTYESTQADKVQQCTITPIESLLGKQDSNVVTVAVLGILRQGEEGTFYLEDSTGQVQVSFNDAMAVEGFYVTENSILLIEATFQDEVLHVARAGSPFPEPRDKSLQILQQQVRHTHFLEMTPEELSRDGSNLVVLSDVHLDQPRVLTLLEHVFQEYDSKPASQLPVFCLMGNFASNPQIDIHQGFEELALLISKFPQLANHAHFVFVPGPNDSDCGLLPQAPLVQETLGLEKTMQSYQIGHVHWGSNPCRIRQNGKEIVLFRYDVLACMLQNQVPVPTADGTSSQPLHSRMVKTIFDQGHLLPIARAPIYWDCDHALRLYPLPQALVLGGSTLSEYHEMYEGCDAIHPGCFSRNGKYAIYSPHRGEGFDDTMSIESGHEQNSRVEFSQGMEIEN